MSLLLDVMLRSSAILIAGLVALGLLRRRSAAVRHGVLAGAVAASALVVPLSLALPAWTVAVPSTLSAAVSPSFDTALTSVEVPSAAIDATNSLPSITSVLIGVWGLGAVGCVSVLLGAIGRLRRVTRRAVPIVDGPWSRAASELASVMGIRRSLALVQTDSPGLLATWGVLPPRILLPTRSAEWSAARIHAVLGHELAHIQRHDWLVQMAAEAIRAIYWFNPLFWLACRRLRVESEQACDDVVLRLGVPSREYAMHLLDVARYCRSSALPVAAVLPMARPSTLERRIAAMLDPRLARRSLSRRALTLTVVGLLGLAIPTAAFRAAQNRPLPLSGVIYDPSGGVLPEAALTLEDERQNKWQTTSDSAGHFEFAPVGAGRYVLEVALAGFRPLRQELDLGSARDWNRAITLQVGAVQESITVREQRPKPRAGSANAGPAPVRVGGNIRPPTKTHDVRPIYPVSMREAGREGKVPLEAIIGRDGAVLSVRVATAQVHPDFAQAAIDAVQKWRFTPTLLNGTPVEVVMTVAIDFQLED